MPLVRTSFQPGEIVNISESEFTDLDRQGLIVEIVQPYVGPPTTENVPLKTVSTSDTATTTKPAK